MNPGISNPQCFNLLDITFNVSTSWNFLFLSNSSSLYNKKFFTDIDVPYELAHVSTWRNSQQVTGRSRSDKKRSSQLKVKKCYDIDVTDDESDAILIGRYAVEKRKEKIEEDNVICWE